MTSRLISVPIDCADPAALAGFWAEVLGWRIRETGFQHTEHGPTAPCSRPLAVESWSSTSVGSRTARRSPRTGCTSTSARSTVTRRPSWSGCSNSVPRPVDVGQGEQSWHVLADPDGNEFCLCRDRVPPLTP